MYDHISSFESGGDDSRHDEEGNDVSIDKVYNAATDTHDVNVIDQSLMTSVIIDRD